VLGRLQLLAALAVVAASAAAAIEEPGRQAPVTVSLAGSQDGSLHVAGQFTTEASRELAWSVLTDYDHLQSFIHSMRSSRIVGRADGCVLVEQTSTGSFLFVKRTFRVMLRVCEEPMSAIHFLDTSHASFDRYEGSWTLQEPATGPLRVAYNLTARGGLATSALTRGASERTARQLLEEVQREIETRRGAAASHP
jgi:hypothetical protein